MVSCFGPIDVSFSTLSVPLPLGMLVFEFFSLVALLQHFSQTPKCSHSSSGNLRIFVVLTTVPPEESMCWRFVCMH